MPGAKNETATYSVRGAARYLNERGVDVSEMRMRTLARQHEIFMSDPGTSMGAIGDSDVKQWRISESALKQYIEAVRKGTVRATASGSKVYKISLNTEQLAELTEWAEARSIGAPVRAFKGYKARDNGTNDRSFHDADVDEEEAEFEDATP